MQVIERDAVLQALRSALKPLPYVIAMWEGGSAAWGRADEWSDIDLQILVEDERSTDTFAHVDRALESLSPIDLRFEVPQPTWHGHEQVFYRLRDAGEYRIVDVAVMRRSSHHQLRERERHGNRVACARASTGSSPSRALSTSSLPLRITS